MHLEPMIAQIIRAPRVALDSLAKPLWIAQGRGELTDFEAECLTAVIRARKLPAPPRTRRVKAPRNTSASLARRRSMAAGGWLPPRMAAWFTQGEVASLSVISSEISDRGSCDWSVGKIAAKAGVGETTVRNATRQAVRLGLLTKRERRLSAFRSDTNILTIASTELSLWLRLRPGGGCKKPQRTSIQDSSDRGRNLGVRVPILRLDPQPHPPHLDHEAVAETHMRGPPHG